MSTRRVRCFLVVRIEGVTFLDPASPTEAVGWSVCHDLLKVTLTCSYLGFCLLSFSIVFKNSICFKIHLLIGQQVPDPQQGQDQAPRTVSKGKEWIIKTLSSFALDMIIYESASFLYLESELYV